MQLTHYLTGKVSGARLASLVVTGVTTLAALQGCVGVREALRPQLGAASRATPYDPNSSWPKDVPQAAFAVLWPNMAYQRTGSSCTVASVSVVVNALRASRGLSPVSQENVVATDRSGRWWRAVQDGGPGLDLGATHLATLAAAVALGDVPTDRRVGVQAVSMPQEGAPKAAVAEAKRALAFQLGKLARRSDKTFLLINFEQALLTPKGAAEGHFSVVGAWDERRERVLVLDVDEERLRPYWVRLDDLVAAMQRADDMTGEPRGYLVVYSDR